MPLHRRSSFLFSQLIYCRSLNIFPFLIMIALRRPRASNVLYVDYLYRKHQKLPIPTLSQTIVVHM